MRLRKLTFIMPAIVLMASALQFISPQMAFAAFTCIWTGGGGDSNFTTLANWSGCNSTTPQPGDSLVFGFLATGNKNPVNDTAPGTTYGSITFDDSGFNLSGNSIVATGDISGNTGNTISLAGVAMGTDGDTVSGSDTSFTISHLSIPAFTVNFSNVTINDFTITGNPATAALSGAVSMTGGSSSLAVTLSGDTTLSGSLTENQLTVPNGVTLTNSGTLATNQVTVADGGTLTNDGTVNGPITVQSGGIVNGSGTDSGTTVVQKNATIAPGHSPGCLTIGTVSISGTYQNQLGGASTACTDYDQLVVTGTVNITNGTLDIELVNGFTPTVGQTFTIVDNQGITPVLGTFKGLAEGATVSSGGYDYKISYIGGDGNDITLTALGPTPAPPAPAAATAAPVAPSAPDTGLAAAVSHPAATLAVTTMAALMIAIIAKRLRPVRT